MKSSSLALIDKIRDEIKGNENSYNIRALFQCLLSVVENQELRIEELEKQKHYRSIENERARAYEEKVGEFLKATGKSE